MNHKDKSGHGGVAYSCPMHPEMMQNMPGKCPKCGMDLVEVSHAGHASGHGGHGMMMGADAAKSFLQRFWVVTFLLIPLLLSTKTGVNFLGIGEFFLRPYLQLGIATVIFGFALVFFEHAKHEIKAKQYGMMTLVSVAVGAGYLFSVASTFLPSIEVEFYVEISTLIWVLLFGHYLEAKSSTAAGDALDEVSKLLPQSAHLITGKGVVEVKVAELKVKDMVMVKPGEKVPADGEIAKGKANFNESLISGESKPVSKGAGDMVVAGAICLDGSVEVMLSAVGENSTVGQIGKLIDQAKQTKPSAQSLADRASGILTFVAMGVALATVLVWTLIVGEPLVFAMTLGITVLVIACPHALGLAIPTVSTIATTLAVKNGLFVKNMRKLEDARNVDYVMFDKTGTLTEGKFGVNAVEVVGGMKEDQVLAIVAGLEGHSGHVIANSVVEYVESQKIKAKKVTGFKDVVGKGIEGVVGTKRYWVGNEKMMEKNKLWTEVGDKFAKMQKEGQTVIGFGDENQVLALIGMSDAVKEESKAAVAALHKLGMKVAMMTGDNEVVAKSVASQLAIDTYFAGVLPEDKYKKVKELQDAGNKVMMVGDGINDAPALTQADVGVAVGAGTEVAVEAGDVVLTHSNPESVVSLVILAKKVYRKMIENLVWAFGYNIVAIPAAAGVFVPFGFQLQPSIGALLMSMSSVIVVINAMMLKRIKL